MKSRLFWTANYASTRFPFGYFTHIKTLVEAQSIDYASMPEATFTIQGHELPLISFAEASEHLSSFYSASKALIKVLLWFGCMFYIYERVIKSNVGV